MINGSKWRDKEETIIKKIIPFQMESFLHRRKSIVWKSQIHLLETLAREEALGAMEIIMHSFNGFGGRGAILAHYQG